mmetsp:Transcript_48252/g.87156  ORF Transcript_48252/g.87156 Transcript_48252/m.87156 type:complete len:179 (-) Transcript_48252:125-661(-)
MTMNSVVVALVIALELRISFAAFPKQHLCCSSAEGPPTEEGRESVQAFLPEAWNHSAMRRANCSEEPPDEASHITRQAAACVYCVCLYDDGALFAEDPCCSLKDFGKPGIDAVTGYPNCRRYHTTFSLATGYARTCELRYDLYPFAASVAAPLARPFTAVLLEVAVLTLVQHLILRCQ